MPAGFCLRNIIAPATLGALPLFYSSFPCGATRRPSAIKLQALAGVCFGSSGTAHSLERLVSGPLRTTQECGPLILSGSNRFAVLKPHSDCTRPVLYEPGGCFVVGDVPDYSARPVSAMVRTG